MNVRIEMYASRVKLWLLSGLCCVLGGALFGQSEMLAVDAGKSRIECSLAMRMGSVAGTLTAYRLALASERGTGKLTKAELSFRVSDLRSGDTDMDQSLREWQETERFPECVYRLMRVESRVDGTYVAYGQMYFHGQARELSFPLQVTMMDRRQWLISAQFNIDLREYGLTGYRRWGVFAADPVVTVKVQLYAAGL